MDWMITHSFPCFYHSWFHDLSGRSEGHGAEQSWKYLEPSLLCSQLMSATGKIQAKSVLRCTHFRSLLEKIREDLLTKCANPTFIDFRSTRTCKTISSLPTKKASHQKFHKFHKFPTSIFGSKNHSRSRRPPIQTTPPIQMYDQRHRIQ